MVLLIPYYSHINSNYDRRNMINSNYDPDEDFVINNSGLNISTSIKSSRLDSLSEYSPSISSQSSISTDEHDDKMQLELLTQVNQHVELKLKEENIQTELNDSFWSYLNDNLNLNSLLTNVNNCDQNNYCNQLKFFQNLNKLLKCLSRVESELYELNLANDRIFEITFLLYEYVMSSLENFIQEDNQFELKLNKLLKFIPYLISKADKSILDSLIDSEEKCSICNNLLDIGNVVLKPNIENLDLNPITESYKCLINNLNALNYYTHDPFSEAHEIAAETGCQADITSYACLNLSYYTMGLFEQKKSLFENSFQFLYELKNFYDDFNQMFSKDSYCIDEQIASFNEAPWKRSTQPNWNFEQLENSFSTGNVTSSYFLEEILKNKLIHVNTPILDNSFSNRFSDSNNTISMNFSSKNFQNDYRTESNSSSWQTNKNDLKPIGAKPASMFNISNRFCKRTYRKNQPTQIPQRNNHKQSSTHIQNQKGNFNQSIWKDTQSKESNYTSPFIFYSNTSNDFEFSTQNRNVAPSKVSMFNNKQELDSNDIRHHQHYTKATGKHSVAPSCLTQHKKVNLKSDFQTLNSNNRSKPSKTVYHNDAYLNLCTYKKSF